MLAADTATPQPKAWHSLSSTCGPGENTWVALETLGAKTSRRRQELPPDLWEPFRPIRAALRLIRLRDGDPLPLPLSDAESEALQQAIADLRDGVREALAGTSR